MSLKELVNKCYDKSNCKLTYELENIKKEIETNYEKVYLYEFTFTLEQCKEDEFIYHKYQLKLMKLIIGFCKEHNFYVEFGNVYNDLTECGTCYKDFYMDVNIDISRNYEEVIL